MAIDLHAWERHIALPDGEVYPSGHDQVREASWTMNRLASFTWIRAGASSRLPTATVLTMLSE
jgi:hypothetical protein